MTVSQTAQWLRDHDHYLILTHLRPDGDTLGCAAGLCAALRKLGKQAALLPNPGVTATYADYVAPYLAPEGYAHRTVVSVDIAAVNLFPDNARPFAQGVDLAIDHHPSYGGFAGACCVDPALAACGELVYAICRELGVMDGEIALPLYVAVSTDTGCFVYSNTSPNTHRVAAALMEYGDFYRGVNKRCFRTKSFPRLRLEGMLAESMAFYDGGALAVAAISREMMAAAQAREVDAEDLAAFPGQIEGVRVSATLRELDDGRTKLSLRTDESLNATRVCALLGGGGHAAASGATVALPLDQAKQAVLDAIRQIQRENDPQ
jgi:phosphoesterase RecJ-like protein